MSIEDMAAAAAHGNRRGFRGRGPWTGVAWDIETGNEVGDCGHRHKVSTDEARNCAGLDRFDTIEVVTVRTDELRTLTAALAESRGEVERLREKLTVLDEDAIEHAATTELELAGGTWDDGSPLCKSDAHKRYQEQRRQKARSFIAPYLQEVSR